MTLFNILFMYIVRLQSICHKHKKKICAPVTSVPHIGHSAGTFWLSASILVCWRWTVSISCQHGSHITACPHCINTTERGANKHTTQGGMVGCGQLLVLGSASPLHSSLSFDEKSLDLIDGGINPFWGNNMRLRNSVEVIFPSSNSFDASYIACVRTWEK